MHLECTHTHINPGCLLPFSLFYLAHSFSLLFLYFLLLTRHLTLLDKILKWFDDTPTKKSMGLVTAVNLGGLCLQVVRLLDLTFGSRVLPVHSHLC